LEHPAFRREDRHLVHSGRFDIFTLSVRSPEGELLERDVVAHPGAVTIVAIEEDDIVFVRQYRASVDAWLLELPAGKLDPLPDGGVEDPALCAQRELLEETGRQAGELELLADFFVSPGWSDERIIIFLATSLKRMSPSPQGPEEQHMEVLRVPFPEVMRMVWNGELRDLKSVVALFLARERLGHILPDCAVDGGGGGENSNERTGK